MTYDANYYATQLGPIPCSHESKVWVALNEKWAKEIVERYNPETVLDVGCSIGLLVKSLHLQGVDAIGFDASEYAISVAKQTDIKHCVFWMPLQAMDKSQWDERFDVVTCIEVLEHIDPQFTNTAIKNLCDLSTKYIIFSSTSDDFEEPTHVNVQLKEYWLNKFALNGFIFKEYAEWLTDWAFVLEKKI